MATYKELQEYIKKEYGYYPKNCWIAHMKEVCGLNPRMSPNRYDPNKRVCPCPLEKQDDIREAFRHFSMI